MTIVGSVLHVPHYPPCWIPPGPLEGGPQHQRQCPDSACRPPPPPGGAQEVAWWTPTAAPPWTSQVRDEPMRPLPPPSAAVAKAWTPTALRSPFRRRPLPRRFWSGRPRRSPHWRRGESHASLGYRRDFPNLRWKPAVFKPSGLCTKAVWQNADPWHFGVDPDPRIHAFLLMYQDPDPDPDPAIFVIDLQNANKNLFV